MAEYLYYFRNYVRKPKTLQRVRLTAMAAPVQDNDAFNLASWMGEYARACTHAGNIRFSFATYPTPPFAHEVNATTTGDCSEGRFTWDPGHRLKLVYNRSSTIYERSSYDSGLTWTSEVLQFASGTHPDIACNEWGLILRSAYVAGAISATRQYPGDSVPALAFNLKDSAGVDLAVEDDSFRIIPDAYGRWWLHVRISGAGTTSLRYSTDDGATWNLTPGATTGIGSGTHPGMTISQDGTMYAWARHGTGIKVTRRAPGDTDWSTPTLIQDDAAASLVTANGSSCFAAAYEGPNRLILATYRAAETTCSDSWSADRATTLKRFV
jgi:hypothetical protein